MRVVVYDEAGEIALDYDTRSDTLSLCPGDWRKHRWLRLCRRPRSL
jgi:hypothetical protein